MSFVVLHRLVSTCIFRKYLHVCVHNILTAVVLTVIWKNMPKHLLKNLSPLGHKNSL